MGAQLLKNDKDLAKNKRRDMVDDHIRRLRLQPDQHS